MNALVKTSDKPVAATDTLTQIAQGIRALMVAFTTGREMDPEDRKLLVQMYHEEVTSFEPAVGLAALRHLRRHNPRIPFLPTPQDVFEAAGRIRDAWCHRSIQFYSRDPDFVWGRDHAGSGLTKVEWGPAPDQPGCHIPTEIATEAMRQWTQSSFGRIELMEMDAERFNAIPESMFDPNARERIIEGRLERQRSLDAQFAHEARIKQQYEARTGRSLN